MRTSTTNANEIKKHRLCYKILAAAVWILVWQLASMWLKQEILLASPVSVIRRLGQLIVTADFWRSIGFSFGRIVLGFTLALVLGTLLAALSYGFSAVEILMDPLITVIKATPVASFIILCLIWIPSRNLSVFISFLMVFPVVYTNLLEGLRQTDKQLCLMQLRPASLDLGFAGRLELPPKSSEFPPVPSVKNYTNLRSIWKHRTCLPGPL